MGRMTCRRMTNGIVGAPVFAPRLISRSIAELAEADVMSTSTNPHRQHRERVAIRSDARDIPAPAPPVPRPAAVTDRRPGPAAVVRVSHLCKIYGPGAGVQDVSFSVHEGEIFGIIGPNGAGKTTTVECISGMRIPDAGVIAVLGLDPQADRAAIRECVGVQLQESALPPFIKVGEVLNLFASFYRQPASPAELMGALGLAAKRDTYFRRLSGGLKQRLSIALALVGNPQIAILDELTTGLDPQARRDTWALIEHVRDRGVTVILVTHFMDEAERLCDRVMLIDHGAVAALDTPAGLAEKAGGGSHMRFVPSAPFATELLGMLPGVTEIAREGERVTVDGTGDLVGTVITALQAAGVQARDVQVESATLDDAYVRLIHRAADQPKEAQRP
jgi:ABC-2 type transport system ATP-binding protein